MTPAAGTFKVSRITGADKSRAVKRALAAGGMKVRITPGQRRTIMARKSKTN